MKVKLIRPLYSKEFEFEIGFSKYYLALGPIALVKEKNNKGALLHLVFSFITFGYYWYWFAKNHNNNVIVSLLNKGWKPSSKEDEWKLLDFNLKKTYVPDTGYIGISRLGGYDHGVGLSAADHLRKEDLKK